MRVLVQRSKKSSVSTGGKIVGSIEEGLVLFVGFTHLDNEEIVDKMIDKIINLRIFNDEFGVMNKSILETGYQVLSISQFTLYADASKGRRPSYKEAMEPSQASKLYSLFNSKMNDKLLCETGIFGSDMEVCITNDGPVTIILEV